MTPDDFFAKHYWKFLALRDEYAAKPQPIVNYWRDPERLNGVDNLLLSSLWDCARILDVGAGDLAVKHKLQSGGLRGLYHTLDLSQEFAHDFSDLNQVPASSYDAILVLEVIEHIALRDFFTFLERLITKLDQGGRLVISTPNAEFISSIWAADMTHVHAYRSIDLAALLELKGFRSSLYRVAWLSPRASLRERLRYQAARFLTRGILQVDYARGILLVAEQQAKQ
jgi:hypothetical protein